jgi:hypothetical protein
MLFHLLFGIDLLTALAALFFFLWGLSDGSVSSFNIGIWLLLLGGIGAVLGGGWRLRGAGYRRIAGGLLALLALPAAGFVVLFLVTVILNPRWN